MKKVKVKRRGDEDRPKKVRPRKDPNLCIVPECERAQVDEDNPKIRGSRGMCASCYQTAARLVKAGKVTWDELEAKGLAEPPKREATGQNALAKALGLDFALGPKPKAKSKGVRRDEEDDEDDEDE